jgi:peptide deformylase
MVTNQRMFLLTAILNLKECKTMNIVTNESELRNKCTPIAKETPQYMNSLINGMVKLMIESKGCGIAAPQVGVNKRLFIAVLDNERIELFVNPVILSHSEETEIDTEGCLSVPEKHGEVERYTTIKVKYFNGKEVKTEEYDGMNARIIQHEYDHLQGVLYIDKATNILSNEVLVTA